MWLLIDKVKDEIFSAEERVVVQEKELECPDDFVLKCHHTLGRCHPGGPPRFITTERLKLPRNQRIHPSVILI